MALYPTTRRTLLEKIKQGDRISWSEFYDRYAPVIRIIGLKSGVPADDIDDLVQEVMGSFFKSAGNFCYDPARARFRSYFNRIVRSRICDILRKKQLTSAGEVPDDELADSPFDAVFEQEWRNILIREALEYVKSRVKPQTFLAFSLTEFEQWTPARAAEFLGITVNSVYVNRKRCQDLLQKKITDLSDGEFL